MYKVYAMESTFHIGPFSEKIENYEIHIFVPNSQNLESIKSLTKYWIIDGLIYTRIRNHSCIICSEPTINFLEKVREKVVKFHAKKKKKRQLSKYVSKVVKHLCINALFTSLIEIWLINQKNKCLN